MSQCSGCGHEGKNGEIKCSECGKFYSRIAEIIAEHEAQEELHTFKGRCKQIWASNDIKQAFFAELRLFSAGLSKKGIFAIFVIFVFVFALIVTVL